jgi:FMN-dependent oxidoreductase (nitrilotriacetate monooxygenase family)
MGTGHHEASWRLPESDPVATTSVEHFQRLAQIAERGTFDSLFLADGPVMFGNVAQRPSGVIEPLTLLTALALVTEHVGLIATASTSYNSPYNLARRFSALDHVSNGRAGWNIVTTAGVDAARNFGVDEQPLHAERYARAAEFIDVTLKLWDSWEDDVVIADKGAGVWGDNTKIHPADHRGKYFSVAGALNSPRSPQAYPLLVQAGSSDDGKDLAARYAEAVFTAQQTLGDAQAFYNDLKSRTHRQGRDPNTKRRRGKPNSSRISCTNTLSACCRVCCGSPSNNSTSTASCRTICRPRARSRTSRAATRSSWRWADERN